MELFAHHSHFDLFYDFSRSRFVYACKLERFYKLIKRIFVININTLINTLPSRPWVPNLIVAALVGGVTNYSRR